MHRDKRLGLALGILLLGTVGAFFFRNEGDPLLSRPELSDPAKLDNQIAENAVVPYLTGLEGDGPTSPAARNISRLSEADPWDGPDFLRSRKGNSNLPGADGPPNPIDTRVSTVGGIPIPRENAAWDPVRETAGRTNRVRTQPVSMPTENGYVIHRVGKGDTLSGLAARYLGSSARFGEIYQANRDVLKSPDDLRLGISLRIPQATKAKSHTGRSARRTETRPISIRDEHAAPPQAVTPPTSPEKPKRFVPVRRSPLRPRGVGRRANRVGALLDDVPRRLTQLPPESRRAAGAETDVASKSSDAAETE